MIRLLHGTTDFTAQNTTEYRTAYYGDDTALAFANLGSGDRTQDGAQDGAALTGIKAAVLAIIIIAVAIIPAFDINDFRTILMLLMAKMLLVMGLMMPVGFLPARRVRI